MKKRVNKTSKAVLRKAPRGEGFLLHSGESIMSLLELVNKLDSLEHHVYSHHVNHEKNDFATWVSDVFKNEKLASDMRVASDKKDIQIALLRGMLKVK